MYIEFKFGELPSQRASDSLFGVSIVVSLSKLLKNSRLGVDFIRYNAHAMYNVMYNSMGLGRVSTHHSIYIYIYIYMGISFTDHVNTQSAVKNDMIRKTR